MASDVRLYEAILAPGLEAVSRKEIAEIRGVREIEQAAEKSGSIRFVYPGDPKNVLTLKTVLAVSLVRQYSVPRPRGLLGDQHMRGLLADVETVRSLFPRDAFQTLFLSAAGSDSPVMMRLKEEITKRTGLTAQSPGDLQIRIRPARGDEGWETLTRLSPRPLSARSWRVCNRLGGLDASVAHAMIRLTEPSEEDLFVNPFCGSGTLLIERLAFGLAKQAIGGDIDPEALRCARENVAATGRGGPIAVDEWDARSIPLPDACASALCADLPFGTQVGSHALNTDLYPAFLREAARIARPGALLCILTGELRLMSDLLERSPQWDPEQLLRIHLAGLVPGLFVVRRQA